MFDEVIINSLNEGYNFKCRVFPTTLHITSKIDEWIAVYQGHKILLKHINKRNNKTRTHEQRKYLDLKYMFDSIKKHDEYKSNVEMSIL